MKITKNEFENKVYEIHQHMTEKEIIKTFTALNGVAKLCNSKAFNIIQDVGEIEKASYKELLAVYMLILEKGIENI